MTMKDLIDLVKLGLKPSDIKEMINLEKEVKDIDITDQSKTNNGTDEKSTTEEEKEEVSDEDKTEEKVNTEDETKDKELLDKLSKANSEIEELKNKIANIQKANTNTDVSGSDSKTIDEQVVDIFNQLI